MLVSADDGESQQAARAHHPHASFYKKDGRMKAFCESLEHHVRAVTVDVVHAKG